MGWVGSGEDFVVWVGLGPEILGWVALGFEKVTHDQLCSLLKSNNKARVKTTKPGQTPGLSH